MLMEVCLEKHVVGGRTEDGSIKTKTYFLVLLLISIIDCD